MNKYIHIIKDWRYLMLFFILVIGFYLRTAGIFTGSFPFTYDIGRDLIAVNAIVYNYDIPLIGPTTGLQGLFYGPWWYYILSVPFFLAKGDPAGVVFFMALTGVATAIILFLTGKKISFLLGFLYFLLVSISPSLVATSSQIWNPNLAPFVLSLIILIIFSMNNKKNHYIKRLLLLGFLLGLSIELEVVYGLLLLGSTGIFLILKKREMLKIKKLSLLSIGFFIIFLPKVLFEIRHDFLMTKSILTVLTGESNPNGTFLFGFRIERIFDFTNLWADTLSGGNKIIGLLLIGFCFVVIFLYRKKLKKVNDMLLYSLVGILVYFLGLAMVLKDVWGHYLVGVPVFMVIILAVSVYVFMCQAKFGKQIGILMCIFLLWINIRPDVLISSLQNPPFEGDAAVYRNQTAVIDYIYKSANRKPFNQITYTPPVHDYTYRYLFMWYGKNTYGYEPAIEKASDFYLILEPDYQNPQRLEDWLKIREGDGEIVSDNEIKGGIRVQRRTH